MTLFKRIAQAALVAAFFLSSVQAQSPDYIRHPASLPCASNTYVQTLGSTSATQATCATIPDAAADGSTKGIAEFTAADFDSSSGLISLDYANGQKATASLPGFLSAADWNTFNGKQAAGNYITALTGDVTASGPGSVAATVAKINGATLGTTTATGGNVLIGSGSQWETKSVSGDATLASTGALTIANNAVTLAKLATQADATFLANHSGGAAVPTADTVATFFNYVGGGSTSLYLDASGHFSQPSSTGGTGWVTAFDIDLSAQSSQTLSSDTTYTIGGITWTKINSANDNVSMALTNGTGLVIQPKGSTQWAGSTHTAPLIYTDVSTLVSNFYINSPTRLWIYVSSQNIAVNGDFVGIGIDNLSTSANTILQRVGGLGFGMGGVAGKDSVQRSAVNSTTVTDLAVTSPLNTTDNVIVLEGAGGIFAGSFFQTLKGAGSGSSFPSQSALRPSTWRTASSASTATWADAYDPTTAAFKVIVFAQNQAVTAAVNVTIKRIKFEYQIR